MSFADDQVLAKLSALNESQESIATAAQWIMFHRRHAERTVQLWLQKLKDSPSLKRLNLIYLANEVAQQSKARRKEDFVLAFSPIIAEATATAYKGAPSDIQHKLRRVVDVWRERGVFEAPIQAAVEGRIDELDKSRGAPKASFGGGSLFNTASVPSELTPLLAPLQNVTKLMLPAKASVSSANHDYDKLTDPSAPVPSAPVYAARLNGLLKSLANAEGAVAECVKARKELIEALEKLLNTNKAALADNEKQLEQIQSRKITIDNKKQDIELAIMSGLATDSEQAKPAGASVSPEPEPDRPEVEALTPPPADPESDFYDNSPAAQAHMPSVPEAAAIHQSLAPNAQTLPSDSAQYHSVPVHVNGSNKRRRVDSTDEFPDLGIDDGLDNEVAEMLRQSQANV